MLPTDSIYEHLDSLGNNDERSTAGPKMIKKSVFSYKIALFLMDAAIATGGFFLLNRFWPIDDGARWSSEQILRLLILSVGTIAYFLDSALYSYHRIFSIKRHLRSLFTAIATSAIALILVALFLIYRQFIPEWVLFPVIFGIAAGVLVVGRLYNEAVVSLLKILGAVLLWLGAFGFTLNTEGPPVNLIWAHIFFAVAITSAALGATRLFIVHVVYNLWMRRHFRRQIAIVGSNDEAESIINHIISNNAPFWVAGIIGKGSDTLETDQGHSKKSLGSIIDIFNIVEHHALEAIIVTDETIDKRTLVSLLDFCTYQKIKVWFPPQIMPIISVKLNIDRFCDLPMIRLNTNRNVWLSQKIKYALDACLTLPVFCLQLPFFGLLALAVKLDSEGPVFYKAQAIGKGAGAFSMYKFRSMQVNNDSQIHKEFVTKLIKDEIDDTKGDDQPLKIKDDPRVTRVGRILRKLSLDELPQLLNVLRGEMSLVGPRPCLPYEYQIYQDWQKKRTAVRPGITGLWQVTGRSTVKFADMILLDLYYIYNRNIMLDLSILYETIFVVLGKKGAY